MAYNIVNEFNQAQRENTRRQYHDIITDITKEAAMEQKRVRKQLFY